MDELNLCNNQFIRFFRSGTLCGDKKFLKHKKYD